MGAVASISLDDRDDVAGQAMRNKPVDFHPSFFTTNLFT